MEFPATAIKLRIHDHARNAEGHAWIVLQEIAMLNEIHRDVWLKCGRGWNVCEGDWPRLVAALERFHRTLMPN